MAASGNVYVNIRSVKLKGLKKLAKFSVSCEQFSEKLYDWQLLLFVWFPKFFTNLLFFVDLKLWYYEIFLKVKKIALIFGKKSPYFVQP